MDLAELGITEEELQRRIVDRMCDKLLTTSHFDEDMDEFVGASEFKRALDKEIKSRIEAAAKRVCDQTIGKQLDELVDGLILQKTNEWGEKKGEPVTLVEYLIGYATEYLNEKVNFEGKTKKADSYGSWTPVGNRLAAAIDRHLHYAAETAVKELLASANKTIAGGIEATVRTQLKELSKKFAIEVKKPR